MIKTQELQGARLDYWVARALKMEETHEVEIQVAQRSDDEICVLDKKTRFAPSTDWKDGGLIIERALIGINYEKLSAQDFHSSWTAYCEGERMLYKYSGRSPLIAAMRALVASVFGDEVEDIK